MDKHASKDFWVDLDEKELNRLYQFHRLLKIMARLRGKSGCPWDKEQTHDSLKPYLIEEAYEVLEQLEEENLVGVEEELGDLLLQIVFHAQIADEAGNFSMEEIARGISDKLVRRHPHIFGEIMVENSQDVLINWEKIKQQEKEESGIITEDTSLLDQVNPYQPALMEAQEIQEKAAKVGFDWKDIQGALAKVEEELSELVEAFSENDQAAMTEEVGDLLFAVVNVARFVNSHSELALRQTNHKFRRRFRAIEKKVQDQGAKMEELSLEVLDGYWNAVKEDEKAYKK